MKKIFAQAWKEFMLFRRDKLLIMLAVLMPVVLMSLAGGTRGSPSADHRRSAARSGNRET